MVRRRPGYLADQAAIRGVPDDVQSIASSEPNPWADDGPPSPPDLAAPAGLAAPPGLAGPSAELQDYVRRMMAAADNAAEDRMAAAPDQTVVETDPERSTEPTPNWIDLSTVVVPGEDLDNPWVDDPETVAAANVRSKCEVCEKMSNASSRYCRECKENLDGLQTWFKQTRTKEEEQCLRDALDNERFRIQCIERYASAQRNATEWPTFEDSIIKIAEDVKQRKLAAAAEKQRKKQLAKLQKQLAGADDYDPEGADDYDLPGADDYPPSVWQ